MSGNQLVGRQEVERKLAAAIKELVQEDKSLIGSDVNERSISHKLAEYLQKQFTDWKVDCEYNRYGHMVKKLILPSKTDTSDIHARTVYPDIIVHHRGPMGENLLVIEMKKESNPEGPDYDKTKLRAFMDELDYQYAVTILCCETESPEPYKVSWLMPSASQT